MQLNKQSLYEMKMNLGRFRKCHSNIRFVILRFTSKSSSKNIYQSDALDIYTDNMLQETNTKWNKFIVNLFLKRPKQLFSNTSCQCDLLFKLNIEEIHAKIRESIYNGDIDQILSLVKVCHKKRFHLPDDFMVYLIRLFAKFGNKDGVDLMLSLYETGYNMDFNKKCGLTYFTAQVLWYSGNMEESLLILEKLYLNNTIRHEVNFVMYDIISSAVVKNEASLVLVTKFVQKLVDDYNIYYPISILWKKLSESEWFADNQLAEKLLHDNKKLVVVISPLIPLWCIQLIQCHKVNIVHRMSEVLLQNNFLEYYSSVLHTLFDYYYGRNNLRLCSAVVKTALDLDMPLKKCYQKRFVELLTTGKQSSLKRQNVSMPKAIERQINFKF